MVAGLRIKIEKGAKKEVRTFWDKRQEELVTLATASLDNNGSSSTASPLQAPLKPAYLAIAALYTIAVIAMVQPASMMDMSSSGGGVVPFNAQEVWWAVRDGYIGDLTSHAFHHGGLMVSDASSSAGGVVGSSLSPQELMWSVRDGYASDTLFASGVGGGGDGIETVPFAPQEVWWAIQNGYASDMAEHWFRNGGLSM